MPEFTTYQVPSDLTDEFETLVQLAIDAMPADQLSESETRLVDFIRSGQHKIPPR